MASSEELYSPENARKAIVALKSKSLSTQKKLEEFNTIISKIEPGPRVTDRKFTFWSGILTG